MKKQILLEANAFNSVNEFFFHCDNIEFSPFVTFHSLEILEERDSNGNDVFEWARVNNLLNIQTQNRDQDKSKPTLFE